MSKYTEEEKQNIELVKEINRNANEYHINLMDNFIKEERHPYSNIEGHVGFVSFHYEYDHAKAEYRKLKPIIFSPAWQQEEIIKPKRNQNVVYLRLDKLLLVDFDDEESYKRFQKETNIDVRKYPLEKSLNGYHLYFRKLDVEIPQISLESKGYKIDIKQGCKGCVFIAPSNYALIKDNEIQRVHTNVWLHNALCDYNDITEVPECPLDVIRWMADITALKQLKSYLPTDYPTTSTAQFAHTNKEEEDDAEDELIKSIKPRMRLAQFAKRSENSTNTNNNNKSQAENETSPSLLQNAKITKDEAEDEEVPQGRLIKKPHSQTLSLTQFKEQKGMYAPAATNKKTYATTTTSSANNEEATTEENSLQLIAESIVQHIHNAHVQTDVANIISVQLDNGFMVRNSNDPHINLDRIKATHCMICDRVHEKENVILTKNSDGISYTLKCYRDLDQYIRIDPSSSTKANKPTKSKRYADKKGTQKISKNDKKNKEVYKVFLTYSFLKEKDSNSDKELEEEGILGSAMQEEKGASEVIEEEDKVVLDNTEFTLKSICEAVIYKVGPVLEYIFGVKEYHKDKATGEEDKARPHYHLLLSFRECQTIRTFKEFDCGKYHPNIRKVYGSGVHSSERRVISYMIKTIDIKNNNIWKARTYEKGIDARMKLEIGQRHMNEVLYEVLVGKPLHMAALENPQIMSYLPAYEKGLDIINTGIREYAYKPKHMYEFEMLNMKFTYTYKMKCPQFWICGPSNSGKTTNTIDYLIREGYKGYCITKPTAKKGAVLFDEYSDCHDFMYMDEYNGEIPQAQLQHLLSGLSSKKQNERLPARYKDIYKKVNMPIILVSNRMPHEVYGRYKEENEMDHMDRIEPLLNRIIVIYVDAKGGYVIHDPSVETHEYPWDFKIQSNRYINTKYNSKGEPTFKFIRGVKDVRMPIKEVEALPNEKKSRHGYKIYGGNKKMKNIYKSHVSGGVIPYNSDRDFAAREMEEDEEESPLSPEHISSPQLYGSDKREHKRYKNHLAGHPTNAAENEDERLLKSPPYNSDRQFEAREMEEEDDGELKHKRIIRPSSPILASSDIPINTKELTHSEEVITPSINMGISLNNNNVSAMEIEEESKEQEEIEEESEYSPDIKQPINQPISRNIEAGIQHTPNREPRDYISIEDLPPNSLMRQKGDLSPINKQDFDWNKNARDNGVKVMEKELVKYDERIIAELKETKRKLRSGEIVLDMARDDISDINEYKRKIKNSKKHKALPTSDPKMVEKVISKISKNKPPDPPET